jgi:hypothetical protein
LAGPGNVSRKREAETSRRLRLAADLVNDTSFPSGTAEIAAQYRLLFGVHLDVDLTRRQEAFSHLATETAQVIHEVNDVRSIIPVCQQGMNPLNLEDQLRAFAELDLLRGPGGGLFAQAETKSGAVGHDHPAVPDLQPLVEHWLQPFEMLDPRFARIGRSEVQVDLHREVRRQLKVLVVGERTDLQERCDAADVRRVGLDEINRVMRIRSQCSATLVSISPVAIDVSSCAASTA